jgi:hypothetical protein
MSKIKLLFVYNADSGLFNTVTDIAHKLLSPKTYACNLCSITHGVFSVRESWLKFLEELDAECEFLHKDEFLKVNPDISDSLPAIFKMENNQPEIFLDAENINKLASVDDLRQAIMDKFYLDTQANI